MFERATSFWQSLLGRNAEDLAPVDAERRVWLRYSCELQTTVRPADAQPGTRLSAQVRDISRGGISLQTNHRFEIGSLLSVELPCAAEKWKTVVLAYIVRGAAQAEGHWEYGCTFASELNEDDLAPFGAVRQKYEPPDQRNWVRFPCDLRATYQRVRPIEPKPPPHVGEIVDISANGVGMIVAESIDVGTLLHLHLSTAAGDAALPMLISVVRQTTQPDGRWTLGCNFLRELGDDELRPFLKPSRHGGVAATT
jgi:hypothetical protein